MTTDEKVSILQKENERLRAQVAALEFAAIRANEEGYTCRLCYKCSSLKDGISHDTWCPLSSGFTQ